jgi:hypothetical protein
MWNVAVPKQFSWQPIKQQHLPLFELCFISMPLNAYIVEAVRTPGGRRNGKLSKYNPADLVLMMMLSFPLSRSPNLGCKGAVVVNELLARTKIDPAQVCWWLSRLLVLTSAAFLGR